MMANLFLVRTVKMVLRDASKLCGVDRGDELDAVMVFLLGLSAASDVDREMRWEWLCI